MFMNRLKSNPFFCLIESFDAQTEFLFQLCLAAASGCSSVTVPQQQPWPDSLHHPEMHIPVSTNSDLCAYCIVQKSKNAVVQLNTKTLYRAHSCFNQFRVHCIGALCFQRKQLYAWFKLFQDVNNVKKALLSLLIPSSLLLASPTVLLPPSQMAFINIIEQ